MKTTNTSWKERILHIWWKIRIQDWWALEGLTWLPILTTMPSISLTYPTFCPHSFSSGSLTGTAPFSTALCFTSRRSMASTDRKLSQEKHRMERINQKIGLVHACWMLIIYFIYLVRSINIRIIKAHLHRLSLVAGFRDFHLSGQVIRLVLVDRRKCYRGLPTLQLSPSGIHNQNKISKTPTHPHNK